MARLTALVLAFDAVLVALGGILAHFARQASRRTESPGLRAVAVAIGVVTVGTVLPGVAALGVGLDPAASLLAGTAVVTLGFVILAYSLYAEYPGENAPA